MTLEDYVDIYKDASLNTLIEEISEQTDIFGDDKYQEGYFSSVNSRGVSEYYANESVQIRKRITWLTMKIKKKLNEKI